MPTPPATDVAERDPDRRIVLEAVDGLHAAPRRCRPRDGDRRIAPGLLVPGDALVEAGEDHDLLARGDDVLDPLGDGLVLGLVQGDADLGEPGQELRVVGLRGIGHPVPVQEALDGVQAAGLSEMSTGTQDLILGGRSRTSSFLRRSMTSFIRRFSSSRLEAPVGHPAVVVPVGLAVALGEGQEGPRGRMADAAQQVEQVPRPVGHRACR